MAYPGAIVRISGYKRRVFAYAILHGRVTTGVVPPVESCYTRTCTAVSFYIQSGVNKLEALRGPPPA
eukprot:3919642-Rhodomonas_salina.1